MRIVKKYSDENNEKNNAMLNGRKFFILYVPNYNYFEW
jgi:hypothetical protein